MNWWNLEASRSLKTKLAWITTENNNAVPFQITIRTQLSIVNPKLPTLATQGAWASTTSLPRITYITYSDGINASMVYYSD